MLGKPEDRVYSSTAPLIKVRRVSFHGSGQSSSFAAATAGVAGIYPFDKGFAPIPIPSLPSNPMAA
jgi:hypothetical protein